MKHDSEILIIYQEIVDGYSDVEMSGIRVYLKHLDPKTNSILESVYLNNLARLKNKGMETEAEKLAEIIENGYWGQKDEDEIKSIKILIDGLKKGSAKQAKISQKRIILAKIKEQEARIETLLNRKSELIGTTAEHLSYRKRNLHTLSICFYKDPELKHKLFEPEDLDYDNPLCVSALKIYNDNSERISEKALKKIGLSSFFINYFVLSEENIYGFFGKPVVHLTFNQSSLIHYGKKYLNIFREIGYDKIPFEIREDADKLVEWFEVNKNFKDIKEQGIIGGTAEDKKALGITSAGNRDLHKAAKEKGTIGLYDLVDNY